EATPAHELVLAAGPLVRVLREDTVVPALGREQAVVTRVPRQRRAHRRRVATAEQVRDRRRGERCGRRTEAREAARTGRDADVLELVREERARLVRKRVTPRKP